MERDAEIRGDRPGGGRPDDEGYLLACKRRVDPLRRVRERELHVDGRGGVVGVLDLCLRESGPAGQAPVHGLRSLVHRPGLHESTEFPQDPRLVVERHGPVRVFPVPQDPESPELLPLDVDELRGVVAAETSLLLRGDRFLPAPQGFVYLVLDRQSVAVPPGDVLRPGAGHASVLDDDVLQQFVESVSDVDMAVRVGGAVVEDELRVSPALLHHPVIQAFVFPPGKDFRFSLRQIRAHREPGLREVQRGFVVHGVSALADA